VYPGPCTPVRVPRSGAPVRRAARAAATARSPSLLLALPLRRRQRRSAGAKAQRARPPL